jgi:hypothetical protein
MKIVVLVNADAIAVVRAGGCNRWQNEQNKARAKDHEQEILGHKRLPSRSIKICFIRG